MLFPNRLFNAIRNLVCFCTPNVIFNIFGFSKVIYVLSCLIVSAIIVTASILFCVVCTVALNGLITQDYLLRMLGDVARFMESPIRDYNVSTVANDTMPAVANDTMSTTLSNIYTHKKPTKIITIHEDNLPLHFPVQQHPRHQAVNIWSDGGGFSNIQHPTRLCNRNNSLLLGYLPRIDLESHGFVVLHWYKDFGIRVNGVLFEFSECAYPTPPTHVDMRNK